jgi:putative ABC transport system permease protein
MHEEHDTLASHPVANTDQGLVYSRLVPSAPVSDSVVEITSLLVQYRSPLAAVQLPRLVNSQTALQAASPAFESSRLFSILGVGVDVLMGFAYVLILISALSIFIALYNSLKERRYDLAIMRSMGASRPKLLTAVLLEGGLLTLGGSLVGILLGHGVLMLLSSLVEETSKAGITGLVFYGEEGIILGASLLLGLMCATIPAIQAYRTDISKVLAGN